MTSPASPSTKENVAVLPANVRADLRRRLLRWYDRNKRDLPWRHRSGDPYAQWVAEIMLQQTRVKTVLDYYERFLGRFPSVGALAKAGHAQVLKYWEGLGYYRRLNHLHRAAQMLCDRGEELPRTVESLRALPGIGEYTAAAIASIAFGSPHAAVDGNVERVIARLTNMTESVRSPGGKSRIRTVADQLLSRRRPGDFNQAWMDLGSSICTPRNPQCPMCPLRQHCRAHKLGSVALAPNLNKASGRAPSVVIGVCGIFVCQCKMLVRRREVGGLWSGLWEFPTTERENELRLGSILGRLAEDENLPLAGKPRKIGIVRHNLTHRTYMFHVFRADVRSITASRAKIGNRRWVNSVAFGKLAVSTAHRKIFAEVSKPGD